MSAWSVDEFGLVRVDPQVGSKAAAALDEEFARASAEREEGAQ